MCVCVVDRNKWDSNGECRARSDSSCRLILLSNLNKQEHNSIQLRRFYPFPKRQILDSCKLKEFADDNFKFNGNGRQFFKQVENAEGKRRNCSLRAISPFPSVFSKDMYCRHVKTRACLGKG